MREGRGVVGSRQLQLELLLLSSAVTSRLPNWTFDFPRAHQVTTADNSYSSISTICTRR